ncbi:MAG: transglycosylase SLT domain-containing protein [Candidatus Aminicenantales bacterium]
MIEVKPQSSPLKTIIPDEEKKSIAAEASPQDKISSLEKDDATSLFEEALNAYQEAKQAKERGDFDAALGALDSAYSLILKVEISQDSPLFQEKNDLRLLIAQRIQEIYASRLPPISNNRGTIPLVENKWVLQEITRFQGVERKTFEEAYMRSGLYMEMITEELRKSGLPEEIGWLPLIESGFKVKALSKARALGLWQFIASTGYRYGLSRDRLIDERMDPLKSTQAAIKYLRELHSFFGDWTTALAAYNCGEIRVQNVIRTQHINYLDNFWDLWERLPYETARFVPRFIAALRIINNLEKYGFNLPPPYATLKFETITIHRPIKLSSLSEALGLESSELAYLNPELRYESTPNHEYLLKIPVGYGEKALEDINTLSQWIPPEATYTWHIVRKGETLSAIARRYRTSVQAIARLNGLRRTYLIRPGQRLKIPGRGAAANSNFD